MARNKFDIQIGLLKLNPSTDATLPSNLYPFESHGDIAIEAEIHVANHKTCPIV